jgi:hypothetical protein
MEASMLFVHLVSSFLADAPLIWRADWAWGVPLIVMTVLVHVLGLGLIRQRAVSVFNYTSHRHHTARFAIVLCAATLLATILHGAEAVMWAFAYQFLGALPNYRSAMLYSLNAITSYGHIGVSLEDHWHLMGALEALNGWLLFGLTTAFLFAVIEKIWVSDSPHACTMSHN